MARFMGLFMSKESAAAWPALEVMPLNISVPVSALANW